MEITLNGFLSELFPFFLDLNCLSPSSTQQPSVDTRMRCTYLAKSQDKKTAKKFIEKEQNMHLDTDNRTKKTVQVLPYESLLALNVWDDTLWANNKS